MTRSIATLHRLL